MNSYEERAAEARAAAALILLALNDDQGGIAAVPGRMLAATYSPLHSYDLLQMCTNLEAAVCTFTTLVLEAADRLTEGRP